MLVTRVRMGKSYHKGVSVPSLAVLYRAVLYLYQEVEEAPMRRFLSLSFALAATAAIAPFAWAHFKLLEPASWIEENNLGDPQKLGPCGGTSANAAKGKSANSGTPTNTVTKRLGGQKVHIKLQETGYHP